MQRMVIISALAFLLIVLIGGFCGIKSREISEEYQLAMEEIEALAETGAWEAALSLAQRAEETWNEKSRMLGMWVNHGDLDEVSGGLLHIKTALAEKKLFETMIYCREVHFALSHLYHRDAFSLKNIL